MIAAITSDRATLFRLLFAIFAILMLPFAIPLLSAKLRARIGLGRVVMTLVAVLVVIPSTLALIAPHLLESHYISLQHKSTQFYVQLAAACDSVLAQHPTGTNEIIEIAVTDPSLPKAISTMHPIKLQVSPNRVWMLLDSNSRAGIGLDWQPKWDATNVWVLDIVGDGLQTIIYSTNRSAPHNTAVSTPIPIGHPASVPDQ